jgi:hypothetical protein
MRALALSLLLVAGCATSSDSVRSPYVRPPSFPTTPSHETVRPPAVARSAAVTSSAHPIIERRAVAARAHR